MEKKGGTSHLPSTGVEPLLEHIVCSVSVMMYISSMALLYCCGVPCMRSCTDDFGSYCRESLYYTRKKTFPSLSVVSVCLFVRLLVSLLVCLLFGWILNVYIYVATIQLPFIYIFSLILHDSNHIQPANQTNERSGTSTSQQSYSSSTTV